MADHLDELTVFARASISYQVTIMLCMQVYAQLDDAWATGGLPVSDDRPLDRLVYSVHIYVLYVYTSVVYETLYMYKRVQCFVWVVGIRTESRFQMQKCVKLVPSLFFTIQNSCPSVL